MDYDVIGDLHGHASALEALLRSLGYRETHGAWRHSGRQALFVGDLIDRGPEQVKTVSLVRRMVDAGSARSLMGNHELNAIAFFTPDPAAPGEFLRRHHSARWGDKNVKQHQAFLREVGGTPLHAELVGWFLTLPLWLELPGLRVVHACWHHRYMEYLAPKLGPERQLPRDLLAAATLEPDDEAEKDTPTPTVFKAVETLLKGIELPLPPAFGFHDKDGHHRTRVRIRWWDTAALTWRDASMLSDEERRGLPPDLIPEHVRLGHDGGAPVFFGHYWLTGEPEPLGERVACVDYSIAKGGKLVAYRWGGEPTLDRRNLHWVGQ